MPNVSEHASKNVTQEMVRNGWNLVTIVNAGKYVTTTGSWGSKEALHLHVKGPEGKIAVLKANKSSQINISDEFGDSSENWVGKQIRLTVEKSKNPAFHDAIYAYPVEQKTLLSTTTLT